MKEHLPIHIKIGTRDSQLALWQAQQVFDYLTKSKIDAVLVPTKSVGDLDLVTPLYAMGVEGIFTKTLDAHLLSKKVDIAVHSMKDVPTQLAQGLTQLAVLKRASNKDILVPQKEQQIDFKQVCTIGTGSIRRKAQWLNQYPHHQIDDLRGNVQTRLRKVEENNWAGAIFAEAGLDRMQIKPDNIIVLDWMLPAPAQGAVMVVCREEDYELYQPLFEGLNDEFTNVEVSVERDFLKSLFGGCSTPIGAFARITGDRIAFEGNILSVDGKEKLEIKESYPLSQALTIGVKAAEALKLQGADLIVEKIRSGRGY